MTARPSYPPGTQRPDAVSTGAKIVSTIGTVMLGAIACGVALSAVYSIDEGERGVKLNGGAIVSIEEPGWGIKIPFVHSVKEISIQTERMTLPKVASYSRDQQVAELAMTVNYRFEASSVRDIYVRYGVDGYADRILRPNVNEAVKVVFGQFTAQQAIQDRARLNSEIKAAVISTIQNTGAVIEDVLIENIDFSEAYEQSVEQRMMAEVEVQRLNQGLAQDEVNAKRKVVTANAEAEAFRSTSQAQADGLRFKAEAEAAAIELRGQAEALSIAAQGEALRNNPDLIKLEATRRWSGTMPTHMLPGNAVPFIDLK